MPIRFLFTFLILLPLSSLAESDQCLEISEQQMQEWNDAQPEIPSFFDLYKAKKIIDAEQKTAVKLGNDKRAHCYLGCRISEEVNYNTADYVAWQKEYNDATDCNPKSHFDKADYNATLVGAKRLSQQKSQQSSAAGCAKFCKKKY